MRCDDVQDRLMETGENALDQAAGEHFAKCPDCRAYARDWKLLRMGFRTLAEEAPPEPMLGFSARLMRRLEGAASGRASEVVIESVGRRVVYAALLAALTLILALVLPSSGPVRAPASAEIYSAQQDVTSRNYAIFPGQPPDGHYEFSLAADHLTEGAR